MKRLRFYTLLVFMTAIFACEDEITPRLEDAPQFLVVDAWITNKPEVQTIKLSGTQNYFDNTIPPPIRNARVRIEDDLNQQFEFVETSPGSYTWDPASYGLNAFGAVGRQYRLLIETIDGQYEAFSQMNRVPQVDSVTFFFEPANSFGVPDSWFSEFWVTDIVGRGDAYWVQGWKNGQPLRRPNEIITAFDAGFSRGNAIDGIPFIAPIRRGFNAIDQDAQDNFLPAFVPGDSLYVELHAITEGAFDFLNELRIQIDRPGGFGELFAQPLANVPTNLRRVSAGGKDVVGFFNTAAVSSNGSRLRVD